MLQFPEAPEELEPPPFLAAVTGQVSTGLAWYVTGAAVEQLVPLPGAASHLSPASDRCPCHPQVMDSKPRLRKMVGDDSKAFLQGNPSPPFTLLSQERGRRGNITEFCFIFVYGYIFGHFMVSFSFGILCGRDTARHLKPFETH